MRDVRNCAIGHDGLSKQKKKIWESPSLRPVKQPIAKLEIYRNLGSLQGLDKWLAPTNSAAVSILIHEGSGSCQKPLQWL